MSTSGKSEANEESNNKVNNNNSGTVSEEKNPTCPYLNLVYPSRGRKKKREGAIPGIYIQADFPI